MKKCIAMLLVVLVSITMFAGCASKPALEPSNSGDSQKATEAPKASGEKTGKTITIKVAHGAPEDHSSHAGWIKFKEVVEAESKGTMAVEIYPNQQLGGDREIMEGCQLGNITAGQSSSAPVASFEPSFFVLDIPFLFKSRQQVYEILDGEAGKALLKNLEAKKLKGLGFSENGFRNLTTSSVAVRKPEDLKGMKVRTMENAIHIATWKLLGANPTPIAFGELFTALQQKTIDGQENPFELIYSTKLHEVQKYAIDTQHIYSPLVIVMNIDFYNGLSEENKKIVDKAAKESIELQRSIAAENEQKAKEKIKEKIEVIELTDAERDAFRQMTKPVIEDVKAKAGTEIVDIFLNATK
ncbi:DctP family TRAP transporter solute-binding subunit [Petroclostridium sp. X23]|uniref:DctP family TRAP transporter solute-binding subunit n=1 Tax=Petroclostridium sp. X23 TaxID=3045146 RepID=UPI0024AE4D2E|nr:DctP family TRAP transporter solute-binding subunit [Petroclostridium sp. X23]WHH57024.1 DctP family TRAP transporter solute-binding subunit [Petroclostridium sp. X23]